MRTIKYILGIFFLNTIIAVSAQQDLHFSQFSASPMTVNPSNAGLFDGSIRALANYRNQWSTLSNSAYTTKAFSIDAPILKKIKTGMFGLGLNVYKDNAGEGNLSTLKYNLNLAYHLNIGKPNTPQYISVGFQEGMIQRSINGNNLSWSEQWTGRNFNKEIYSIDGSTTNSISKFDMAAGVNWFFAPSSYSKFYGGFSMYHIGSPNISFYGSEDPLLKKYTLHGGFELGSGGIKRTTNSLNNIVYSPNFIYSRQGSNQYFNIGLDIKYKLSEASRFTDFQNEMSISGGLYYRYGDAVYLIGRINNWQGLTVGLSYDINVSSVPGINGGVELILGYTVDFNPNIRKRHNL